VVCNLLTEGMKGLVHELWFLDGVFLSEARFADLVFLSV
jgi:hypothetical protein